MEEFDYRLYNLSCRSCNESLGTTGEHTKAEIVQWDTQDGEEYCWTLAYWDEDKEGYSLIFVGDRPLSVDAVVFMKLVAYGQQKLKDYFLSKGLNE